MGPPSKSASVAERRASPRQPVSYRLDVIAGHEHGGCLLDVSTSGARVRFKRGLDIGSTRTLRIEFPRWLELGAGLDVTGRFVWLRATESGGTDAGFAFDGLSRKEASVLEVLIQRISEALLEDRAAAE